MPNPITIDTEGISPGGKISLAAEHFPSKADCTATLTWEGGGSLTIQCKPSSGTETKNEIKSGTPLSFQIPSAGEYAIAVVNDGTKRAKNVRGSIVFTQKTKPVKSGIASAKGAAVVYDSVEMRRYEGKDGHPYIHERKRNGTSKTIVGYERGMLVFDKEGKPLKIDWWSLDTEMDSQYYYLYTSQERILPGETSDLRGGFSLNIMGKDTAVSKIAYVLYCDREISFEDGSVWKNPDYEDWLATYKGKKVDVNALKSYYPYEQPIE